MRCTLMHTCPAYANDPYTSRATAQSRSAVSSTIAPALPPSSRTTFFLPASAFIFQPTEGEPVNESSLYRSSPTMASPVGRSMGRMLTAPLGRSVSSRYPATRSMTSGSFDGGLSTIEHPAAMAGATLCTARLSGKLKGLIPATGPIG